MIKRKEGFFSTFSPALMLFPNDCHSDRDKMERQCNFSWLFPMAKNYEHFDQVFSLLCTYPEESKSVHNRHTLFVRALFTVPSPCSIPVFMLLRTIIIIAVVTFHVYLDIKTPVVRRLDWPLFFEKKIGQCSP